MWFIVSLLLLLFYNPCSSLTIERKEFFDPTCQKLENNGYFLSNEFLQWDEVTKDKKVVISELGDIVNYCLRRRIYYDCLVNCTDIIRHISLSPVKFNIFILTGNRAVNAFLSLTSLKRAIENRTDTRITLIEMEEIPYLERLSEEFDINYIFLPNYLSYLSGCAGLFPKSLGFNIGFKLVPQAIWNIFHDVDIIVPENWMDIVNDVTYNRQWFIAYDTLYQLDLMELDKSIFKSKDKIRGANVGGSVAISTELFIDVGGYDPEIFCGWSSEDIFFVDKLKVHSSIYRAKATVHHVNHKLSFMFGFYNRISAQVRTAFVSISVIDKRTFLATKKNLLMGFGDCDEIVILPESIQPL